MGALNGPFPMRAPMWHLAVDAGALAELPGLASGVVLVAGAVTMAAAPALAAIATRDVLRDAVVPPPELHTLPSPPASFRGYVKKEKDTVPFTVDGLPKNGRLRLAAMDSYDGVAFNAAPNSSASFSPVGDPAHSSSRREAARPSSASRLTATPGPGTPA